MYFVSTNKTQFLFTHCGVYAIHVNVLLLSLLCLHKHREMIIHNILIAMRYSIHTNTKLVKKSGDREKQSTVKQSWQVD